MSASQAMTSFAEELSQALLATEVSRRDGSRPSLDEGTSAAVDMVLAIAPKSGKIMLVGNGGSAAIVSHMHNDVCKAVGIRGLVFNEAPLLTALTNDDGYEFAFERCVRLWASPGDLLIAISSSGRSENILRAVRAAINLGVATLTMSGFSPENPLRQLGDLNFYVPSDRYGFVEIAHQALGHCITDAAVPLSASRAAGAASD